MSNITGQRLGKVHHSLRIIPYIIGGFVIFSVNSIDSFNYFFKGYLILLECQAGVVMIYFLMRYLKHQDWRKFF